MKERILTFVRVYFVWVLLLALQKPIFMLFYYSRMGDFGLETIGSVMGHGLTLDLSVAAYLTVIHGFLLLLSVWIYRPWLPAVTRAYLLLVSVTVASAFVVNIALYAYWGFPLDFTPLFYLFTSPKDAMASLSWWMLVGGLLVVALQSFIYYACVAYAAGLFPKLKKYAAIPFPSSLLSSFCLLLLTLFLLLPIRGGLTVSTANTGKVYFSENQALNHAAVNPVFSFIESLVWREDFDSQYRFMDGEEADALFARMVNTSSDSTRICVWMNRPDVYILVLESFSSALFETEAVPCLQKMTEEGLFFTQIYANSFRTDRGLVAIQSGFPAQPTMSLMQYPQKTAALPSIAGTLKKEGYDIEYYYGGDADFTNMRSYLVNQGFEKIVCDADFAISERLSKWGVHDDKVFARLQNDLMEDFTRRSAASVPQALLRILQTSSSHEPFEVPYRRLEDDRLNAFAYTDSCVGQFVNWLKQTNQWERSLVLLVSDHQGCWPTPLNNDDLRHYHIPMVVTGGVVKEPMRIETIGSQQDIAATLLGQLGIPHDEFLFSKDLLNPAIPHFAFFTVNDLFGMLTTENQLIFDNRLHKTVLDQGLRPGENQKQGQAYLQKLYEEGL